MGASGQEGGGKGCHTDSHKRLGSQGYDQSKCGVCVLGSGRTIWIKVTWLGRNSSRDSTGGEPGHLTGSAKFSKLQPQPQEGHIQCETRDLAR